ncbi:efflux RND transporter permease subunit [Diaphorobacter sp. JS3051]|uniref:efflux RND transporter permease subunit n=1 Tax=Diaphorobacter sp. JS3051 TaxID=2792224 RepID=UPI0018C8ED38|nr:efflux RND transporter permease subunit [Diaphorobacter sp. JS3051]QPN29488.1 efflux RND transporter permease subunit [Diaphorobacter sp. JS3051]
MSKFFINRPIFAWVIAIVIMLLGVLAIKGLAISQYPNVAPPAIRISVTYPGASAQTVQDTVVQVIEQQLNGLDGLRYITSASESDSYMQIVVTFEQGTDPDIAQVQVQNKLNLATPMLPQEVQQQGIRVAKYQMNFMMVVGLVSEDGRMNSEDLADYIASNIQDPVSRTKGVGDFTLFGAPYAMRIWLDPAKLNAHQLTPTDVIAAVQSQNVQISAGQLGGLPTINDKVQLQATVLGKTRMKTADEFREIMLKVRPNGAQVRLKDVADVQLGGQFSSISGKYDGKPASGLALRLATGGNVLESIAAVRDTIAQLEPNFPQGVKVVYPYDTSPVVQVSIDSVIKTLLEAIVLVFLVMLLFLQSIRATIIPTLAVPVVLLGTFGILLAAGFTINLLTMFAMVLAIGLLVDDAIVVVENVERLMHDEHLSPKEATIRSMGQISGALVGIGVVISAVFVPMAFMDGSAGVIYRQFAITIAAAMSLSVLVALIFTPALCATILKAPVPGKKPARFFAWFNRVFNASASGYAVGVEGILKRNKWFLLIYVLLLAGLVALFARIPTAFLPEEDQGTMMVQVQLPSNASAARTDQVLQTVSQHLLENEKDTVHSVMAVNGFNFAGRGQNSGLLFVELKPFDERKGAHQHLKALYGRTWGFVSQLNDAMIIPIMPPAIIELGNATGYDFFLQDNGGVGHEVLMQARNQMLGMAAQSPKLALVRPNGLSDEPQYQIEIDEEKARALNLNLADINATMSIAWGSAYINDFIDRGRVKKVFLQGKADARVGPEDFAKWYVRNNLGKMVPFSAFATGKWVYGPAKLERYNGVPALQIVGSTAPGVSTGEAMAILQDMAKQLPPGVDLVWTGLSYEEIKAGDQSAWIMALSMLVVFLCLAALYESWSIPFSVMLVVPLGILGAVLATLGRGLTNDVFFQIGMITTMGLAAKNAILIVEFARELYEDEGKPLFQAVVEAARLRLRPIVMTSLAFVLGVVPLAIATGASSGSQHSIGTSVVGGTLAGTFLAIFFVPLFFYVIASITQRFRKARPAAPVTPIQEKTA